MANERAMSGCVDRRSVPGHLGFAVSVLPAGGVATVRVTGDLDCHTASQLGTVLAGVVADGIRQVTLDVGDTSFMDSTGLSVVIGGLKRLREHGGDMVVKSPTRATRNLFEMTGLDAVLTVV